MIYFYLNITVIFCDYYIITFDAFTNVKLIIYFSCLLFIKKYQNAKKEIIKANR